MGREAVKHACCPYCGRMVELTGDRPPICPVHRVYMVPCRPCR